MRPLDCNYTKAFDYSKTFEYTKAFGYAKLLDYANALKLAKPFKYAKTFEYNKAFGYAKLLNYTRPLTLPSPFTTPRPLAGADSSPHPGPAPVLHRPEPGAPSPSPSFELLLMSSTHGLQITRYGGLLWGGGIADPKDQRRPLPRLRPDCRITFTLPRACRATWFCRLAPRGLDIHYRDQDCASASI